MNTHESNSEQLADVIEKNMRLNDEIERLRTALEAYANCRHAQVNCNCTMEARAALWQPKKR